QGHDGPVFVGAEIQDEVLGGDEAAVGDDQVDLVGAAQAAQVDGAGGDGHHRPGDLGLEGGGEGELVVIGYLGGRDGPGVADQVDGQEGGDVGGLVGGHQH